MLLIKTIHSVLYSTLTYVKNCEYNTVVFLLFCIYVIVIRIIKQPILLFLFIIDRWWFTSAYGEALQDWAARVHLVTGKKLQKCIALQSAHAWLQQRAVKMLLVREEGCKSASDKKERDARVHLIIGEGCKSASGYRRGMQECIWLQERDA